jgi:hypothetical protein
MTPTPENADASIVAAERVLLRALCHRDLDTTLRDQISECLQGHRFHEARYEIVFKALRESTALHSPELHARIAARLTRQGFPDVDLDELFAAPPPVESDIQGAMSLLAAGGAAKT